MADDVKETPRPGRSTYRVSVRYVVDEVIEVEGVTLRAVLLDVLDRFHGSGLAVALLGDGSVIDEVALAGALVVEGSCPLCGADGSRVWVDVDALDDLPGPFDGAVRCGACGDHSGVFPVE